MESVPNPVMVLDDGWELFGTWEERKKNAIGGSSWVFASPKCSYYVTEISGESILKGSYYTLNINVISLKKGVRSTLHDQIQS